MKTICLLVLTFASLTAVCQKSEYLVKQNGDTLYGEIQVRNKEFIVTGSAASTITFSAAEVKTIHSPKYNGHLVVPCKLRTYTDEISELRTDSYNTSVLDTVMILNEVYSTPKMNLYFGKDDFRTQYYFYKTPSDSMPRQLYINYYISGAIKQNLTATISYLSSATHIEVQKGYVNQLRLIMGDCKKISDDEWESLDYRIYSLKAVIKKYNKCK